MPCWETTCIDFLYDAHLHSTFLFDCFKCLMLFTNLHFSSIIQHSCMENKCSSSPWIVSEFASHQYCLCVAIYVGTVYTPVTVQNGPAHNRPLKTDHSKQTTFITTYALWHLCCLVPLLFDTSVFCHLCYLAAVTTNTTERFRTKTAFVIWNHIRGKSFFSFKTCESVVL